MEDGRPLGVIGVIGTVGTIDAGVGRWSVGAVGAVVGGVGRKSHETILRRFRRCKCCSFWRGTANPVGAACAVVFW